ncbi:hypothetical protein BH11MYX3_BH11MYX3_31220 [soil metagenome]
MKTLDDQMPSGYFEGLPNRTLARLEDVSMQPMGTTGSDRDRDGGSGPAGVPPMTAAEREEDSGLHDIRSLASSTKARISSRRSTQNPVMSEDDILASSSAGWKAVALPEPAKMISLPALTELPSAKETKEKDKAARKAKAAEPVEKKTGAAVATATAAEAAPASISSIPSIGSRIAAKGQSSGKGKTIALVGMGLAAAAGVSIYFAMNKQNAAESSKEQTVAVTTPAAEYKSTAKMLPPPPPPAAAPEVTAAAAGSAAPVQELATSEPVEPPKAVASKGSEKPGKVHKVEVRDTSMTEKSDKNDKSKEKAAPKEEAKKPDGKDTGGEGEPSFDALLKEAGVSDAKKQAKPTLDKKSLSGGDIKSGMGSIAGKAQACYAGTQGAAAVKLTVAPSGQVQKVSVSGVFAGTPVAACVSAAVKSATFPPWDGGPQTINYSYLLSE